MSNKNQTTKKTESKETANKAYEMLKNQKNQNVNETAAASKLSAQADIDKISDCNSSVDQKQEFNLSADKSKKQYSIKPNKEKENKTNLQSQNNKKKQEVP